MSQNWRPVIIEALSLRRLALVVVLCGFIGCDQASKPSAETASSQSTAPGPALSMVFIPPGEFIMGADDGPVDAKPSHAVKVDGFMMDQTEVTQAAYQKIIGSNPSRQKNQKNPVEQVTWAAAARFCNARSLQESLTPCYNTNSWECNFEATGYRLPTEAEWEYACRAGSTNQYSFGNNAQELKAHGWFEGNAQAKPHPVAALKANAWNLFDMAGNVSEWCNDFYSPKYYRNSPKENPRGPQEGEKRILRGGAWSSNAENCTSWIRNCDEPGLTDICLTMDSNGFRCVRKPTATEISSKPAAR